MKTRRQTLRQRRSTHAICAALAAVAWLGAGAAQAAGDGDALAPLPPLSTVPAGHAGHAPTVTGNASIGAGAAAGTNGSVTVNEAAGLNNVQANQVTIATGTPLAAAAGVGAQATSTTARVPAASVSIGSNAFSHSSGALMINQAAGAANLQSNSVGLGNVAPGVETVTDAVLSATAPNNGGHGPSIGVQSVREASISGSAIQNVSGIAQINQTAGAGNTTANSFVLRPPAGTFF